MVLLPFQLEKNVGGGAAGYQCRGTLVGISGKNSFPDYLLKQKAAVSPLSTALVRSSSLEEQEAQKTLWTCGDAIYFVQCAFSLSQIHTVGWPIWASKDTHAIDDRGLTRGCEPLLSPSQRGVSLNVCHAV